MDRIHKIEKNREEVDTSRTIDDAESAALEAASIAFSAFNPGPQHGHVAYLHRMKAAIEAYKKFKGE